MHLLPLISLLALASASAPHVSFELESTVIAERDGAADAGSSYWLEDMTHQGIASFNPDVDSYKVFRNVKDFGAKGDGQADDTAAIQEAIASGNRCAPGACSSTTITPAVVYIPCGTYLVNASIINYYYTQIIGNPNCLPTVKASSTLNTSWIIDGNQYQSTGALGWGATNVFWTQIRNLVIDTTDVDPSIAVSGIHWAVSQATSLQNIVFKMSEASGTQHMGLFMEEGSGGFLSDLIFYGGHYGLNVGNQQFTMRNLTFHNAVVSINQLWSWGWTYTGLSINNCTVGINMSSFGDGGQTVGSMVVIDSEINDTPIGIQMARDKANPSPASGGSLVLENIALNNVPIAVQGLKNATALAGSTGASVIQAWAQGHAYSSSTQQSNVQNAIAANARPSSLTTSGSDYYARSMPQYEGTPASQFVSVRAQGAKGDGKTDDTAAVQLAIDIGFAQQKIVFFDAGYYKVSKTIQIHRGARIVGEAFPVILSSGDYFADMSFPKPVVQVGVAGEIGNIEWSNMIVSTQGAQAGAILIEYNLASEVSDPSGMWNVHTRVGGFAGSNLQVAECSKTPNTTITSSTVDDNCIAAYMSMHVTKQSSGLYMEGCWLWVADHDVDDPQLTQITVYAGRGLLIESQTGGIWLYGTGVEHHVLYEYQLVDTKDVMMGQIQTETAYYQPNPDATIPFPTVAALNDPVFSTGGMGWGLRVVDSQDVLVYGAGLYSFFDNYDVNCSAEGSPVDCQTSIFSVEGSGISVYNLNTVGTVDMITVEGQAIAQSSDNRDGFVDTIALFRN
ncbi:putative Exo-beta-1,3-glucanae [Xylariaceae sp. FL0016]|nr:putative Exo-beta-1,3-glucanae [Xylariaceae sp. FL0016]